MNLCKILIFFSAYILPFIIYAEEKKGGMPQLDPSSYTSQTFWLIISFIILFLFINSLFVPKIINIRNEREKTIKKYISDAESINNEASMIKERIDKDLLLTKSEIDKKLNIVIQKHTNLFEKKIKEMNLEFEKKIEKMNLDLLHRKKEIVGDLGKFSFEISNIIYNKILDENKKINISEFNKLNSGD